MSEYTGELLCGIAGVILGFISSYLLLRFNYRQLFAQTVSSSRMQWINSFREEIGIVVAALQVCGDKNYINTNDIIYQAEKARTKLLTRLNQDIRKPGNELNKDMSEVLLGIDFSKQSSSEWKRIAEHLVDLTRKILEPEWKRVKDEARGKHQK